MTFIKIDKTTYINAEIIALIAVSNSTSLYITTKNGKEYYIEDNALALRAVQKLELL